MEQRLVGNINCSQERIILCNENFFTHPTGALIWPDQATLIVSDLYLRSGLIWSALKQHGDKTEVSAILTSIKDLIDANNIKTVIALGRGFRRLDDPYHIESDDLTTLYYLQKQVEWIWAAGPMARDLPHRVGGIRAVSYKHGGLTFRAIPRPQALTHEIAGGMFPMAKLNINHQEHHSPCFLSNSSRLIMPAFGGARAAHNILGDKFLPFFGCEEKQVQIIRDHYTAPVNQSFLIAG